MAAPMQPYPGTYPGQGKNITGQNPLFGGGYPYPAPPTQQPALSTQPAPNNQWQQSAQTPIVAPQRTTIGQAFNSIQGLLPKFSPIQGYGNDYYQNLSDQAAKRLQLKYFTGTNALLPQRENDLKRRGIYGGQLGEDAVNNLYTDFGTEMSDIQSGLNTQKAQNDLDLSKYNQTTQNQLAELGLNAASKEADTATNFDTNMFKNQVTEKGAEQDYYTKLLNTLTQAMGNELTDKNTRQYFENIFGSQIGQPFGYSPPTGYPFT